jgi:hypothetical protein
MVAKLAEVIRNPEGDLHKVELPVSVQELLPLWQLDIVELAGHNLESRGRGEVNRLLSSGWRLLHIYTLKYEENGIWRERPMGILGRPRTQNQHDLQVQQASFM